MRIVRLANFVAPHSGGLRTSLAELGTGYLAAGHEPVARRYGTVHLDAARDPATYERCYWSVDRLHPNERGHRLIACRFHALLAAAGFPVGPGPDPEPSSPPPTRLAEVGWVTTKGTAWLVRRSRDLVRPWRDWRCASGWSVIRAALLPGLTTRSGTTSSGNA